jgi:hypothetical protein
VETSAIEALIAQHYADSHAESELHDLLAVVAERSGKHATDADLQRASQFVRGYIELVPYMMKVAWTAASNVGLEDQMQRVLAMVRSYWKQQDDIIPDYLGIIGLLDGLLFIKFLHRVGSLPTANRQVPVSRRSQ